jgi:hypothetical protein
VDKAWTADITYIPLQKGFLYLVAAVGLFARCSVSIRLMCSVNLVDWSEPLF